MGYYEPYVIGRRNLQSPNHWETLDSNFKITKPTVLCFGGNGTVSEGGANSMCKIAQSIVGIKDPTIQNEIAATDDVDFIGIGYGRASRFCSLGCLTDDERLDLVEKLFLPFFADENGNVLQREQIIKNFNQVTFFAHCQGASEIASLIGFTYKGMTNLGIDTKTANEAIDQMFAVAYAPFQECACPSLQVVPMKDKLLQCGPVNSPITGQFLEDRYNGIGSTQGNGTVVFKDDYYTTTVLVSDMTKDLNHEHSVGLVRRDENWNLNEELPIFGDEVSQVMGNALASSIANSIQNQESGIFTPTPSLDKVMEETKSILGSTQNGEYETAVEEIRKNLSSQQQGTELSNLPVEDTKEYTMEMAIAEYLPLEQ